MKFGAFYLLAGAEFTAAALKTTAVEPWWGWLFALAVITTIVGAMFEAINR